MDLLLWDNSVARGYCSVGRVVFRYGMHCCVLNFIEFPYHFCFFQLSAMAQLEKQDKSKRPFLGPIQPLDLSGELPTLGDILGGYYWRFDAEQSKSKKIPATAVLILGLANDLLNIWSAKLPGSTLISQRQLIRLITKEVVDYGKLCKTFNRPDRPESERLSERVKLFQQRINVIFNIGSCKCNKQKCKCKPYDPRINPRNEPMDISDTAADTSTTGNNDMDTDTTFTKTDTHAAHNGDEDFIPSFDDFTSEQNRYNLHYFAMVCDR